MVRVTDNNVAKEDRETFAVGDASAAAAAIEYAPSSTASAVHCITASSPSFPSCLCIREEDTESMATTGCVQERRSELSNIGDIGAWSGC